VEVSTLLNGSNLGNEKTSILPASQNAPNVMPIRTEDFFGKPSVPADLVIDNGPSLEMNYTHDKISGTLPVPESLSPNAE
jgi:hypothetical protein